MHINLAPKNVTDLLGFKFATHKQVEQKPPRLIEHHKLILNLLLSHEHKVEVDSALFATKGVLGFAIVDTILEAIHVKSSCQHEYHTLNQFSKAGKLVAVKSPKKNDKARDSSITHDETLSIIPREYRLFSYVSVQRKSRFIKGPTLGINPESFEIFLDLRSHPDHRVHFLHAINNMLGDAYFLNLQQYYNVKSLTVDMTRRSTDGKLSSEQKHIDPSHPHLILSHGKFYHFECIAIFEQADLARLQRLGSNSSKFCSMLFDIDDTEFILIYDGTNDP